MSSRNLSGTSDNPIHRAADKAGEQKATDPSNPSMFSSAGAIGKHFNADGAIGQIPQKIGGPFSKDGMIGSQFDASKGGIAGTVERAVDGPSQAKSAPQKMGETGMRTGKEMGGMGWDMSNVEGMGAQRDAKGSAESGMRERNI